MASSRMQFGFPVIAIMLGVVTPRAIATSKPGGEILIAPDKTLTATVHTTKSGESEMSIGRSHGRHLYSMSFASSDGEHGATIQDAAWTPDSRFFVVGLQLSGGHGPWHFPIYFWDRTDRQLRSLDEKVGGITGTAMLTAPDVVSSTFMGPEGDAIAFSISLSSAVRNWGEISEKDCKIRGGKVLSGHGPASCSNNEVLIGRIPGMRCDCACCATESH